MALVPLFAFMQTLYPQTRLVKIHRRKLFKGHIRDLAPVVVAAYDIAIRRARDGGWKGRTIYVDHGLSPVKYYAYRYTTFHECDLLFYPGPVFERTMKALNPNFNNGLLGGLPKMDELVTLEVDREALCQRYGLDTNRPIVLFAPTWGGRYSKHWGLSNAPYLDGYPNLIIAPHPADYRLARKFNAVVPDESGNINMLLKFADVVVSEVSSVVGEAAILDKPVVQLILPDYPGCFPLPEKRKEGLWLSKECIEAFAAKADPVHRPFKLAYLDEDWVMGHTTIPEKLPEAVDQAIAEPDRFQTERRYWAEQCCYKPDGGSVRRIGSMIQVFLEQDSRKQLG